MWVSFWSPEITVVISCIIYFYKKVPADCSVAVSETLCMCVCVCAHTYACVRSHAGVHMFMCQVYGMRRFQGKVFLILPFHMNFISQYSFFFFLSNVGLSLLQDSFSPSCKSRGLQNPPLRSRIRCACQCGGRGMFPGSGDEAWGAGDFHEAFPSLI